MDLRARNKHLYARAGFGITIDDYAQPLPIDEAVGKLFPTEDIAPLSIITEEEWKGNSAGAIKAISDKIARKEKEKEFRGRKKDVNLEWVQAMVSTSFPLVEKAALFWHGHFATHINNPYYDQLLLNTVRKHALGNFGVMLREVSRSPAMLQFLNNRQNRKAHPNENFAREVMELFTLGRGHYTEGDVKEAARAFTGWSFDAEGNFIFRQRQHDDGAKTFLGKTGNFTGDDILNILLAQKQTAVFITQKLYRYFVSDERVNDKRVNKLAADFYNSNYDIALLLRNIFTADWFYADEVTGAKIKAPVELLVGYQRIVPMRFENDKTILNLQRALGQVLFRPPNVAGWPGGKNWIDSSSLVIRMRLPEALYASKELNLSLKDADAEMDAMHPANMSHASQHANAFRVGKVAVDWNAYNAYWSKRKREELPQAIADYLLPVSLAESQLAQVVAFADKDTTEEYVKSLTILIMELPEYQLA